MPDEPKAASDPFSPVRASLSDMQACLAAPSVDLIGLAKAYAALAGAMLEATRNAGQTSMRFEVVARALDLRTNKSVLKRFLDGV